MSKKTTMKEKLQLNIEKGIPMPDRGQKTGVASTFRQMKVGDSVVLPVTKRNGAYVAAKIAGIKIACRSLDGANMRVWRMED